MVVFCRLCRWYFRKAVRLRATYELLDTVHADFAQLNARLPLLL